MTPTRSKRLGVARMQLRFVVICLSTLLTVGEPTFDFNGLAPPELVQKASPKLFKPKCKVVGPPLDLMIVFDSSGSLSNEFAANVKIISDVLDSVTIGPDATRVELIEYAGTAKVELRFGQALSKELVQDVVAHLINRAGITRTDIAMQLALNESTSPSSGIRGPEVPKILLIISDGRCTDCGAGVGRDVEYGRKIRELGIFKTEIWAFGTGDYSAVESLAAIAGSWKHIYEKTNRSQLMSDLAKQFKGTEVCESVPVCIPGSDKPVDVLFVLDGSGSIENGFRDEVSFVTRTIQPLYVHPDSARVAVIHYSTTPTIDFDFLKYQSNADIISAVKSIDTNAATTNTELALRKAKELLLQPDRGVRNASVPKLVLVLTDGYANTNISAAAEELTSIPNIRVYAVGVRRHTNADELFLIAGKNQSRVFTRQNLDQFENELKSYVGSPCPGVDLDGGALQPYIRPPFETTCTQTAVVLTVRTRKPFEGKLYAPDFLDDNSCAVTSGDGKSTEVTLTLTPGKCGVKRTATDTGFMLNGSAMIQFHPAIITQTDQIIPINCFYASSAALQQVGQLQLKPPISECTYRLTKNSAGGCVALEGTLGENIFHTWTCDNEPDYDFLVRSCNVTALSGETKPFLDSNGCYIDKYMLETPKYPKHNHQQVYREGYVYRFPKSPYLTFKCKISICQKSTGECDGIVPPVCDKRVRRSNSDHNFDILHERLRRRAPTFVSEVDVETRLFTVQDNESTKPIGTKPILFCPSYGKL